MNVYSAATLRLGHFKTGEKVDVKIMTNKSLDLNPSYFQSLDQTAFLASLKKFRANSLKITSTLNHDTVRGTIDVAKDSPMLFSIPYDDGWSIKVDGKKAKIHKVVDNLMAVNLKAGKHQVALNYQVPGLKLGWAISILSVGLFATFNCIERKKRKLF